MYLTVPGIKLHVNTYNRIIINEQKIVKYLELVPDTFTGRHTQENTKRAWIKLYRGTEVGNRAKYISFKASTLSEMQAYTVTFKKRLLGIKL